MKVIEDYEICYPKPLDLKVGDQIQLFERDVPEKWRGWNWCKDSTGNEGWISETYFIRNTKGAVMVKDYTAKEISVANGDNVEAVYSDCGWSWCKKTNGDQGWLPSEILIDDTSFITERLILRNYRSDDWERVHIYGSVADFSKYELWGPNTVEDTQKFLADMVKQTKTVPRYKFDFAVCLKEENLLIGGCGIRRETEQSHVANLGWAINPDFQRKGYATEAAEALIQFGFNKLGLRIIYATCDTRNTSSFKVMEKLGMKKVGLIKADKEVKGYLRDTFRYEILPS